MATPQQTQCLIFVVYEGTGDQKADCPLDRSKIQAYALLPQTVKCTLSDLIGFFTDNGVEVIDPDKENPSLFAADKQNSVKVCEMLLDEDGKVFKSAFKPPGALHVAITPVNRKLIKLLFTNKIIIHPLKSNKAVNGCDEEPDPQPFFIAAFDDRVIPCKPLKHYKSAIKSDGDGAPLPFFNATFGHGIDLGNMHLLHYAVQREHETLLKLLLKHGCSVNSEEKDVATPLLTAVSKDNLHMVEELLKHGANVNAAIVGTGKWWDGFTPLHGAISRGHLEIAKCLLENGADVDAEYGDCDRHTSFWVAVRSASLKAIDLLLEFRPNLNTASNQSTFLHAIEIAAYQLLLQERDGAAPLPESKDIVEKLFLSGSSIDSKRVRFCTLSSLVTANFLEILRKLVADGADVNHRSQYRGELSPSLLHYAAEKANEGMVSFLLENGASVNAVDKNQRTPVFSAVLKGRLKNLELLVEFGASVCCVDVKGLTPLHVACGYAVKPRAAEFLLQRGADVNAECNNGKTCLCYALQKSSRRVVEVLLKFGARFNSVKQLVDLIGWGDNFNCSPPILKTILEYYFYDPELFGDIWDGLGLRRGFFRGRAKILSDYGCTVTAAFIHSYKGTKLDFFKNSTSTQIIDLKRKCESEIELLKSETIGSTNVSFHDVLMADPDKIACYLRNESIARVLMSDDYKVRFPLYAGILKAQFLKGNLRKALLRQGIKACHFLFLYFNKLPYNVKEKILMHLSNEEIKVILNVCKLTHIDLNKI